MYFIFPRALFLVFEALCNHATTLAQIALFRFFVMILIGKFSIPGTFPLPLVFSWNRYILTIHIKFFVNTTSWNHAFKIKSLFHFQDISVSVSVFTLTFIAYDRYNAICRPLQFSSRKTNAALVITIIWSVSAIIGIPDAVTLELFKPLNLQGKNKSVKNIGLIH